MELKYVNFNQIHSCNTALFIYNYNYVSNQIELKSVEFQRMELEYVKAYRYDFITVFFSCFVNCEVEVTCKRNDIIFDNA